MIIFTRTYIYIYIYIFFFLFLSISTIYRRACSTRINIIIKPSCPERRRKRMKKRERERERGRERGGEKEGESWKPLEHLPAMLTVDSKVIRGVIMKAIHILTRARASSRA